MALAQGCTHSPDERTAPDLVGLFNHKGHAKHKEAQVRREKTPNHHLPEQPRPLRHVTSVHSFSPRLS